MSAASMLAWRMTNVVSRGTGTHAHVERRVGPDAIFGMGPYPRKMSEFVGQETGKQQLMTAMLSASTRGAPMGHTLFASGTPGIGKTTLGKIVAAQLEVGYVELGGQVKDKEIRAAIEVMQPRDVLFLDEVHRLVAFGKRNAEWLLQLLQDGVLVLPTGVVKCPPITVIAATTDAQKLPKTILDRFEIQPILEPYTDEEAYQIAQVSAKRLGVSISETHLRRVAAAADCNPRVVGRLLATIRDILIAEPSIVDPVARAMVWTGQSHDGLSRGCQDYLMLLLGYGGTAGLATLKAALGESEIGGTESYLIQRGYIQVTGKGRELTRLGSQRAADLLQENAPKEEA